MKTGTFAICAFLLAGCATGADTRLARDSEAIEQAAAAGGVCYDRVAGDPAYAPLAARMSLSGDDTLLQMASTDYATDEEALLLSSRMQALAVCSARLREAYAAVDARLGSVLADEDAARARNALSLVERKQTWGQYLQTRQRIVDVFAPALDEVANRHVAELRQMSAEQALIRAQALQGAATLSQQEQARQDQRRQISRDLYGDDR